MEMRISRCTEQAKTLETPGSIETLEQFYAALIDGEGEAMLALLERLQTLPSRNEVWGLTSHSRLCLLSKDDFRSPWFVVITADQPNYVIEFLMPEDQAPWSNARVIGEARSLDEAVPMILTAIDKSQGWDG